MRSSLIPEEEELLGEGGLLSKNLCRFEYRPQQMEMAQMIFRSFREGKIALVEAVDGEEIFRDA